MGTWRDTLFVWSGKVVETERGDGCAESTWKGAWVGVDSATADAPTTDEAKSSANEFTVKVSKISGKSQLSFEDTEYLLDNGDGLETRTDPTYFVEKDEETKLACAKGENEFGSWVSVGLWEGDDLVMARRYVGEDDPRAMMKPKDVLRKVQAAALQEGVATMPWVAPVCCCGLYPPSMPKPKTKSGEEEEKEGQRKRKRSEEGEREGEDAAARREGKKGKSGGRGEGR